MILAGYDPPMTVGDPPPHQGNIIVNDKEFLDYAHWIDRRVNALHEVMVRGLRDPKDVAAAQLFSVQWVPWHAVWKSELAGFEAPFPVGTFHRFLSWSHLQARHGELMAESERARAIGLNAAPIEAVATPENGLGKALSQLGIVVWGLAALAAIWTFGGRR
jgi:hypothetical protein